MTTAKGQVLGSSCITFNSVIRTVSLLTEQLWQSFPLYTAYTSMPSHNSFGYKYKFQNVLNNNGDIYNPNDGVSAIPDTGVWAMTISVRTNYWQGDLFFRHIRKHHWVPVVSQNKSFSLLLLTLSRGDEMDLFCFFFIKKNPL